jgi:DNA-binding NarL/FixJ family response regulator
LVGIAIIGGSRLYRESLQRVLNEADGLAVVGTASSLEEGVGLVEQLRPEVLVVDLEWDRDLPRLASMRDLRPRARIVVLGVDDEEATVVACAEAGVVGYLPSDTTATELVDALERVGRGELVCPPRTVETLLRWLSRRADRPAHSLLNDLTRREREVVELIRLGLSNKQIAERLCIQVATVKSHVHSVLVKLNVERRAEVAALMHDAGA